MNELQQLDRLYTLPQQVEALERHIQKVEIMLWVVIGILVFNILVKLARATGAGE